MDTFCCGTSRWTRSEPDTTTATQQQGQQQEQQGRQRETTRTFLLLKHHVIIIDQSGVDAPFQTAQRLLLNGPTAVIILIGISI